MRRYENELVDYGKLRNAIVHRTGSEELFIANPSDEVVETIEFIAKQLCDPPRIADAFKVKPLAKVFADKPLLTAVEEFAATCKKSIVVYDHGKTAGVLNTYYVFRLIAERAARGESVTEFLKNTPCGDVLDARQLEHYVFLSGEATVFDVFAAFERQKELYAVIVTENGAPRKRRFWCSRLRFPRDQPLPRSVFGKNILSGRTFCLRARIGWSVRGKRPY